MPIRHPHPPGAVLPPARIGMVSTFPPTICGLATFAMALTGGLRRAGHRVDVVRIGDESTDLGSDQGVVAHLTNGDRSSVRHAAAALSRCDAVIVQHEYGIFGGADGEEVVELLQLLGVPTIVVLHTVPLHPSVRQRDILGRIGELADRLVVMTEAARTRLLAGYAVDVDTVDTIPHGALVVAPQRPPIGLFSRTSLLTWGLLGPGKGVEHVIDAMGRLSHLHPRPHYTVSGVTHPNVLARDGDTYRTSLVRQAWTTGVADLVGFDDNYRDTAALARYVAAFSVVVLPYDSRDQVTSGVLVDAIAAGRPVIATAFPHAVELLSGGAGIVVPHQDPQALAEAVQAVVLDAPLRRSMTAAAQALSPSLSWTNVAASYAVLVASIVDDRQAVAM